MRKQAYHSFERLSDGIHSLEDKAQESITCWTKKLENILDTLHLKGLNGRKHTDNNQIFDKILDWGLVAAKVFQSLKR